MHPSTEAGRYHAHEQALASAKIEGYEPGPQFLADCAAVIAGSMTREQARSASLARARAEDRAAAP